jgi:hypothetical protein
MHLSTVSRPVGLVVCLRDWKISGRVASNKKQHNITRQRRAFLKLCCDASYVERSFGSAERAAYRVFFPHN